MKTAKKQPNRHLYPNDDETGNNRVIPAKLFDINLQDIYTIINCIGTDKPAYINNSFTLLFGNEKGSKIYNHMKKQKFQVPPVNWKKETRMKKMIQIIYKYLFDKEPSDHLLKYMQQKNTWDGSKKAIKKNMSEENKSLKSFALILKHIHST